jgi:hypothetical protein
MQLELHLQDGRPEEENFIKKQVSLPSPLVVTSFPLPHDKPSTQWDSVVKVNGCAWVVGIFPMDPRVCRISSRPSGDGLIDSGANVGMSGDKSILVSIHSIEAIPLGLALTPSNPSHISYCTRMDYLPLLLADDDVLLVPTLVNSPSTKTIISLECVMKLSSNIVRWEQHGLRDGLPGQLQFFHSNNTLALKLKLTCKEGLYYYWLSTVTLDSNSIHVPISRQPMGTASISCVCPKNDMRIEDWLSDGDILPSKPHTPYQLDDLAVSYLIPTPKSDTALRYPTTLAHQLQSELWAAQLGHCEDCQLQVLPKRVTGLPSKFTSHPFRFINHKVKAQIQKQPAGQHAVKPPLPGQRFFMDFAFMRSSTSDFSCPGLATDWVVCSLDGLNSYLLVVDELSRYCWVFRCSSKEPPIDEVSAFLDIFGRDNGGVIRCN